MILDPAALPDDVAALKAMLIAADKRAVEAEAVSLPLSAADAPVVVRWQD